MKIAFSGFLALLVSVFVLCLSCCDTAPSGEKLARRTCSSCHLFPEPSLLDKQTWAKGVLPEMAKRLGLGDPNFNPYFDMTPEEIMVVIQSGAYPDKPLIEQADWEKIVQYYTENAPEKPLPQAPRQPISDSLKGFAVHVQTFQQGRLPAITYVGASPKTHDLFAADRRNQLFRFHNGQLADSVLTDSPVVDLDFEENGFDALEIGIMDPNDQDKGSLWQKQGDSLTRIQDHLYRPVSITRADLNQDGLEDRILCQHGNHAGRLSWYENQGNGKYTEHILRQQPGARRAIVTDWNHDGKPDILCLFAQAREGVYLFLNEGSGKFEEKALLEFSPVFGSSYLDIADMNGDGYEDLVYTNGDNADYSYSLKNYHGIRIFLNDGHGNLKESWFFPVNGASKALISDFDGDGDPDMAVISFFADPKKNDSFLYFENRGNLTFDVSTFPQAGLGKWLVACAGDVDGDGDEDIVLGSFLLKSLGEFKLDPKNPPPSIIILENLTR